MTTARRSISPPTAWDRVCSGVGYHLDNLGRWLIVNAPTIGAEVHLPFGGTKATGNGHREAGLAALDVFSEWKSVYVDFSGKLQRAQID